MCACTTALLVSNPFAAVLAIPALNLWIWVLAPDLSIRRPVAALLLALGLIAPVVIFIYYAQAFAVGPASMAWTGVLMLAGGKLGIATTIEWCVMAGCTVSVVAIGVRVARRAKPAEVEVTVRGPVTYAGPGSLGGTKSAIRR
jgi:hypothetical protein